MVSLFLLIRLLSGIFIGLKLLFSFVYLHVEALGAGEVSPGGSEVPALVPHGQRHGLHGG